MSNEDPISRKLLIEPEPAPTELVAILLALQTEPTGESFEPPISQWAELARREQMRRPLDNRRTGWTR